MIFLPQLNIFYLIIFNFNLIEKVNHPNMDNDVRASKREVQERLNKQYIDSKINPIIEPMALDLFTKKVDVDKVVSIFRIY